ncbi:small acid-soluble spore protein Tlp [Peribacillus huizhouensis]|uniref:Small, acid-soluble spore protein Tlp n=1 Tax=Peribacillus huizhouensis TaxID=1501239 RepID=A0ABR6CVR6_9BACI|nr:small acid-soluble spore protein Tlp [Peribacillus huizhouensis]MBA9029116.1 small acid-soluble spore protein (thioredoxin-like protein) [Peribacillus huizhouensis]
MNYKHNPDDRSDNVEKLEDMIQNTMENIEAAEETLEFASGDERNAIKEKNQRRQESIESFKNEIQDEKQARENGFE